MDADPTREEEEILPRSTAYCTFTSAPLRASRFAKEYLVTENVYFKLAQIYDLIVIQQQLRPNNIGGEGAFVSFFPQNQNIHCARNPSHGRI
jgi:hypothetical protein